jgi:hypothetical protein
MAAHLLARGLGGWAGFALGVAAGLLIETVGPGLAKGAGPAARSVLKFFFRVTDEIGRSTARFREKTEDFVAETRAEYDAENEAESGDTDSGDERPPEASA